MQISETYQHILEEFNQTLLGLIPNDEKPLNHAARYVLENGGKRIRPLLALTTCLDLCGDLEIAYTPVCALELIHNYSLVHDDLPCMDDDDTRRGKLTVHKAYSEAIAVLLGDLFLTQAFDVVANANGVVDKAKVALVKLLTHYSGGAQLLEGQMQDLSMSGKIGHYYDLLAIYLRKTSSLFCCALEFGAILSGATLLDDLLLKEVGQKIGLAFQIANDFKGKKQDQKQDKFTIFSLHNEKQAKILIQKNVQEAVEILEKSPHTFKHLTALIESIFKHEI